MKPPLPKLAPYLLALACVILAPAPVPGQSPLEPAEFSTEAAPEAPPVYEVEFLIFAYNEFNPLEEQFKPERPHWPKSFTDVTLRAVPETLQPGSADWMLDSVTAAPEQPSTAAYPSTAAAQANAATSSATVAAGVPLLDESGNTIGVAPVATSTDDRHWYRILDPDELQLGRAFDRLNALGAYTPLLHAGWSQPTLFEDEAKPFELSWLGQLEPAGTIRLHRSRFLHLTVDISLQDAYAYRQAPLAADARWPLAEFQGPLVYRIDVQRRVRSGEVHFFDHPAFGVLITVRPAPETPEEQAAGTAGPAA